MKPDALLPAVYDELRKLAAAKLAWENPGQTLSATALVHEAYLRLSEASVEWRDKTHFHRAAATAMRCILVDRARAKQAEKRGGNRARVELGDVAEPADCDQLVALDAALEKLAAEKPDHARLVELRFFAGLSSDEAAAGLGVSVATADRMWRYARAWLHAEIGDSK